MGWHALLQGIFPTQGSKPCLLYLLHRQAGSSALAPLGKPKIWFLAGTVYVSTDCLTSGCGVRAK